MNIIGDWRKVAKHAASVRFMIIAGVFAGAEATLPFMYEILGLSARWFAAITFVVVMAALVSRFIAQKSISGEEDGKQAEEE